jgi:hypothetical protein
MFQRTELSEADMTIIKLLEKERLPEKMLKQNLGFHKPCPVEYSKIWLSRGFYRQLVMEELKIYFEKTVES